MIIPYYISIVNTIIVSKKPEAEKTPPKTKHEKSFSKAELQEQTINQERFILISPLKLV